MTAIFDALSPLDRSMSFHLQRQNLIAANISNVDTPGYVPKELRRTDETLAPSFSLTLRATKEGHMGPSGDENAADYRVEEERHVVPGNDLNYVSMDHEMARLGANSLRFKVLGRLVTHHLGVLRYAAQDGR